jgi:DNA-binding CsgD family transcriptional regulator
MSTTVQTSSRIPETALLEAMSADVFETLGAIAFPAYIVDANRRVRWQNAASIDLLGDVRGRLDSSVLGPEDLALARRAFARKQHGAPQTELEVAVTRVDGTRVRVAVTSVPLRNGDGEVIGSFGVCHVLGKVEPLPEGAPQLSGRERETLAFLVDGYSTAQMARQMDISKETVRNHVKGLLKSLGARSRVEAIAKARSAGLI